MVQSVVVDANIFFHMWILDPILTLADEGLFEPLWSDAIMEEVARNLPKVWKEVTVSQISSFLAVVNESYPYAKVPDWREHMEGLELPDLDDCHVLAAAIAAGAASVITLNLADFPQDVANWHDVKIEHPDDFLCRMYDGNPQVADVAIRRMIENKKHPPRTLAEEYAGLDRAGLHKFARRIATG